MSQELYDMIPVICGAFFVIYGVLMMACPKAMIKKEWKENPEKLANMRKKGPIVIICGIVNIVIGITMLEM